MTNMIFFFKYGNEYGKQIFILYFKLYFIFYSYLINEIEHIVMFRSETKELERSVQILVLKVHIHSPDFQGVRAEERDWNFSCDQRLAERITSRTHIC